MIGKAAAVVPHPGGAPLRLLCFDHPLAGPQIVKGTIRPEEPPLHAARRELWEEAGLTARSGLLLGQSADIVAGEIWHFALLRVAAPVPDRWGHLCQDDGGHIFQCRWQDVGAAAAFTGRFARAWTWIGQ
ncbi:MAG: NUDIX domain-containing protein, partial [Pseudomonadota bacterium]